MSLRVSMFKSLIINESTKFCKKICKDCKTVRRQGRIYVICKKIRNINKDKDKLKSLKVLKLCVY